MSIKDAIQTALKDAMKNRDADRLECLRMAKGALLVAEKAKAQEDMLSEDESVKVLRAEVRKRQQSMVTYAEVGRDDEVEKLKVEIAIIEEFLPQQLNAEQIEEKIRAYLADHPEINHPGKLTGAMKKELGDTADGKVLNEVCRKVLGA